MEGISNTVNTGALDKAVRTFQSSAGAALASHVQTQGDANAGANNTGRVWLNRTSCSRSTFGPPPLLHLLGGSGAAETERLELPDKSCFCGRAAPPPPPKKNKSLTVSLLVAPPLFPAVLVLPTSHKILALGQFGGARSGVAQLGRPSLCLLEH